MGKAERRKDKKYIFVFLHIPEPACLPFVTMSQPLNEASAESILQELQRCVTPQL